MTAIMTSMTLPPTKFEFSPLTEAKRLLFTATQLSFNFNNFQTKGSFYLSHNFYLLPYFPKNPPPQLIYFPDLPYHQIPNFWSKISKTPSQLPFVKHQKLAQQLASLLDYQPQKLQLIANETQLLLDQYFPKFWQTLSQIFPQQTQWLNQIIIMPTLYGSIASFNRIYQPNQTLYLYLRQAAPKTEVFRVILFALIYYQLQKQNMSWSQINKTVDYFLTHTSLNQTLPQPPTLLSHHLNKKQRGLYYRQTITFIKKLGLFHLKPNLLHLKDNHPYYYHTKIKNLGEKELALLILLLRNRGQVVTYDMAINHLWPHDDDVFEWRVTKLIQRLRQKLKHYNIPPNTIQAIRGQGYLIT